MTASEAALLLSRKRLLIFDLDGTLVDSSPIHARAFNEAFARHGVTVDYERIAGMTTDAAVAKVAAEAELTLDAAERAALVEDKRLRSRALMATELRPIDGSVEFVRAASDRGYRMALCTSGSRDSVALALRTAGIEGCFEPVIVAEDVTKGKPDPECFLMAVERHGAPAAEALIFEDAPSGLAAADAAGIEAVHVAPAAGEGRQVDWGTLNRALAEARP